MLNVNKKLFPFVGSKATENFLDLIVLNSVYIDSCLLADYIGLINYNSYCMQSYIDMAMLANL